MATHRIADHFPQLLDGVSLGRDGMAKGGGDKTASSSCTSKMISVMSGVTHGRVDPGKAQSDGAQGIQQNRDWKH